MDLCDPCHRAHTDPLFRFPNHLVHPRDGKPMLFDVYGLAICPDCLTGWYRGTDNAVVMIGRAKVIA